jgi:hypothetical protein
VCSGRDAPVSALQSSMGNGDFFTGSAEGNRLMNKRQFYHRVTSGIIGCAYGCSNIGVSTTYKRAIPRMCTPPGLNRELQRRARSNGDSTTVSAEGNRLMNERVPHHWVVSGVPRDAQTPASRSHQSVQTLGCVSDSDRTPAHRRARE